VLKPARLWGPRSLERGLRGAERVRVRARVIGATHRDLPAMVAAGEFRADLYYRLSALIVDVPPLRDRGEDVLLLARDLLPEGARLTPEAEEALRAHSWPGNVRELRNAVRRAAALAGPRAITPEELRLRDLPAAPEAAPEAPRTPAPAPGGGPTLQEVSDQMLVDAIEANGGNRKAAAQQLGIARSTLYRRLKKLGMD